MHEPEALQAYVLHVRDFTDSKKLVTAFTNQYGLQTWVARPTKRWPPLQAFHYFLVYCAGKSKLKTIRSLELIEPPPQLRGRNLYCALYLNELLSRALPEHEAHTKLFESYHLSLKKLAEADSQGKIHEVLLRRFEFLLLAELGLGLQLNCCADGSVVHNSADVFYEWHSGKGLQLSVQAGASAVSGEALHELVAVQWTEKSLRAAKVICRLALPILIGHEPLTSRALFR